MCAIWCVVGVVSLIIPFPRGLAGRRLLHGISSHPYRGGLAPILRGKVSPMQLTLERGGEKPVPPPWCALSAVESKTLRRHVCVCVCECIIMRSHRHDRERAQVDLS